MVQSLSLQDSTCVVYVPSNQRKRIVKVSFFYRGSQNTEPQLLLCMCSNVRSAPMNIYMTHRIWWFRQLLFKCCFQFKMLAKTYLVTTSLLPKFVIRSHLRRLAFRKNTNFSICKIIRLQCCKIQILALCYFLLPKQSTVYPLLTSTPRCTLTSSVTTYKWPIYRSIISV